MSRKELSPYLVEVNRVARLLMDEWARVEPKHAVTLHHVSYISTFVDMAKVVVNDAIARGLHPPDNRHVSTRIEEALRAKTQTCGDILRLLGVEHTVSIRNQVEDIIYDMIRQGKICVHPTSQLQWVAK